MAKPKIRFKGYTNDWEQRKLGEMIIDHNAGIYISKEDYGEGTNVIGVGNIYDRDIFDGEIYRLGPVNDDKFILEENDIIYGESSLVPEGIARTVCVGKNGAGSAFAWHTRRVKLDKNIVNSHVATLELNYLHEIRKYLVSVSTQTALTGMTTEGYFGATLTLPSVEEQQVISDYFKNLDHLITLHQRKCDQAKKLKKYMLQKMFPKNNKSVPEIRFEGFSNDWEQRKLGELGEILTGSTPSTSNSAYYSEDGIPWVTPTDINELTISDTPRKLSEEGAKVGRVVPANTILCTCIASIGKNALLTVKGSFNQQINSLTPSAENDAYFLLTESELWSNKMKRMAASGTMQIVNKTEFSELDTLVPSTDEQKKIGSYFRNLDHLITLHQKKCDQLKNLKKFMLQNMFV